MTEAEAVRRRRLHMIGNAHIDPVWLWQWPEGYQEVRATFASALDRLDEYPEFVFTCTSMVFLSWVEESDPALFERIRARIAEGRWQLAGGWWMDPDCNIPGGESLVRQGLYGQRYLLDRFGFTATTLANVDSFGHAATLPQILRGAGLDSYVFLRPGPHERELPGPVFWWHGPDGSRVLAYRIPHEYGSSGADLGYQIDKSLAQIPSGEQELMIFYGVGNHGGGPTRANLDSIRRLNAIRRFPELLCSSPQAYFDTAARRDGLPQYDGDLHHHGVGCYSAHSGIKRWNRRAEQLLQRAEKWAAVASLAAGRPTDPVELAEAWKLVLFNQFHDILAGTSIAGAYDDARDQLGYSTTVASLVFNRAVQSICARMAIPFELGTTPVVVFNAHAWPVSEEVELEFAGYPRAEAAVVDEHGAPVPVQATRSQATVSDSRGRLVFRAELPPLGYRLYRLVEASRETPRTEVQATDATLENEHLALSIDPRTGWLDRLELKADGLDLMAGASGRHAVLVDDESDTWGHRVHAYDHEIGELPCTSVRLVEHGPVRGVIRVERRLGASTLVEEISLAAGARVVDVRVTLDWHEQLRLLKLRFPTAVETGRVTYERPYGHVEHPADGHEEVAQAWVDVSGTLPDGRRAGLSVLNDGKPAHDARGGEIGMTVVRSPVYAWHEPCELAPGGIYDHLDQGRQDFRYRLVPHAGDWRAAGTVRLAAELNQPAFALLESAREGDLPPTAGFASVDHDAVDLVVLKAAEDGDGLVLRAYETAGHRAEATIRVGERTIAASFGPGQIRTFRLPGDPAAAPVETDLIER
jgi:alpha-mannosidase